MLSKTPFELGRTPSVRVMAARSLKEDVREIECVTQEWMIQVFSLTAISNRLLILETTSRQL
jgi:hypothetical protein